MLFLCCFYDGRCLVKLSEKPDRTFYYTSRCLTPFLWMIYFITYKISAEAELAKSFAFPNAVILKGSFARLRGNEQVPFRMTALGNLFSLSLYFSTEEKLYLTSCCFLPLRRCLHQISKTNVLPYISMADLYFPIL